MASDPKRLRPADLVRLLNSTPLGTVVDGRRMRLIRDRFGLRIGDGGTVDLIRYTANLALDKHATKNESETTGGSAYERHRQAAAERIRDISESGRDIGAIPAVVDPERRAAGEGSFRQFCELYFPDTFSLAWSDDHLKVIARIETAVKDGGLFAFAMPRGSGKSSLCEAGAIWSMLLGRHEFIACIGPSEDLAVSMLANIRTELETNERLGDDFPEVCYPVRKLEGIAHRARGQIIGGVRTHIEWGTRHIVLPTVPGSRASGCIVKVAGLTGQIRGMRFKRPDGRTVRPSLVILDDPQTDESARSPSQCRTREALLAGAILGLAGPGQRISGIMPCTVIAPGDMADRILDREKHPQWHGERTKLVYAFPKAEKLWAEYGEIVRAAHKLGRDMAEANAFYEKHRAAMDEGAVVAWPARKYESELSAIQHAMNLRIMQGEQAFAAEYQNEPMLSDAGRRQDIEADAVMTRTNGLARGTVPLWATRLTAFVDVQKTVLWWMVVGWGEDFSGAVVDYGTWPDQGLPYFTLRQVRRTLAKATPGAGVEGALRGGLDRLAGELLSREWQREGEGVGRIERMLVDANYETETVYRWCRETEHAALVMPAHGRAIGAAATPFTEYQRRPGERLGMHWRIPSNAGRKAVRHLLMDVNWWKTFVARRLTAAVGDKGALTLFGKKAQSHRMLADHLTSERPVEVTAKGRTIEQWQLVMAGRDNHWWDCLVGSAVAASMQGAELFGEGVAAPAKRVKVKLSDLQRDRGRRG